MLQRKSLNSHHCLSNFGDNKEGSPLLERASCLLESTEPEKASYPDGGQVSGVGSVESTEPEKASYPDSALAVCRLCLESTEPEKASYPD